jgi:hypothetical protein
MDERPPQRPQSKQTEPHGFSEWEDDWMMEPRAQKPGPKHKERPPMLWDHPHHPEMMESPMRPNRKSEPRSEWESPDPRAAERPRKKWEEMPHHYDETALLHAARRKKPKR